MSVAGRMLIGCETMTKISDIADAQRDMRFGYYMGAPGILASGLVWLIAGLVALVVSPEGAVLALFMGGMFIHPAGVMLAKLLGRPGGHSRGNPLGMLALEATVLLLLCLPVAYVVSLHRVEWFFPAMLLIIGGRYLTFATLYGLRVYWALGGVLAVTAIVLVATRMPPVTGAFAGGIVELAFAIGLFIIAARENATTLVRESE